jgi:hypothetical protein
MYLWTQTSCQSSQSNQSESEANKHLPADLVQHPVINDAGSEKAIGRLVFADTLHDFGRLTEGEVVTYDFECSNQGNKDVIISEAHASCGCTVPEYPKEPLRKGDSHVIKVTFNSEGKKGYNEKLITVTTNGLPSVYSLYIRAEVVGK